MDWGISQVKTYNDRVLSLCVRDATTEVGKHLRPRKLELNVRPSDANKSGETASAIRAQCILAHACLAYTGLCRLLKRFKGVKSALRATYSESLSTTA